MVLQKLAFSGKRGRFRAKNHEIKVVGNALLKTFEFYNFFPWDCSVTFIAFKGGFKSPLRISTQAFVSLDSSSNNSLPKANSSKKSSKTAHVDHLLTSKLVPRTKLNPGPLERLFSANTRLVRSNRQKHIKSSTRYLTCV